VTTRRHRADGALWWPNEVITPRDQDMRPRHQTPGARHDLRGTLTPRGSQHGAGRIVYCAFKNCLDVTPFFKGQSVTSSTCKVARRSGTSHRDRRSSAKHSGNFEVLFHRQTGDKNVSTALTLCRHLHHLHHHQTVEEEQSQGDVSLVHDLNL